MALIRDPKIPAAARAEAGRKLAELGDPRPGVGLRPDGLPDIAWVDIPAGSFIMGSDDHSADEKPRRSVTLGSFAIGMFPVTYAQYKAFLEAKDGSTPHGGASLQSWPRATDNRATIRGRSPTIRRRV